MKKQHVCSLRGQFYQWKWIMTFKKMSMGLRLGFSPSTGGGRVREVYNPPPQPPLRRRPHVNHAPLRVEGVYDQHGVDGVEWLKFPQLIFLKSLSISICKIVHVRNKHTVFSYGLHLNSDVIKKVQRSRFGIYLRLN